jgi:SAM-dependent methyltransferase
MKITKCRNCKSQDLKKLFSLGNMSFTGKFSSSNKSIPKGKLIVIICTKCKLVQLDRNFNKNYLYGLDYGYRTGINKTMSFHVLQVKKQITKKIRLKPFDQVLDIGSNDATLLNSYNNKKIIKVGMDPLVKKYNKFYSNIDYALPFFFSDKKIPLKLRKKKFKIITALSMFYDLEDPNEFLKSIKNILHNDGILLIEQADLYLLLKNNVFDTICHEHLEYYSTNVIMKMLNQNGLKLFDHKFNKINGGSSQYYICHQNSSFKVNERNINKAIKLEKNYGLEKIITYKKFYSRVILIKNNLKKIISKLIKKRKKIHGYGASTKGNVLLQLMNITSNEIKFIAERNPNKYNKFTPGSKIQIISEKESRKLKPDYYLVLPWHFKDEILIREKKMLSLGCKFIFPLPKIEIK